MTYCRAQCYSWGLNETAATVTISGTTYTITGSQKNPSDGRWIIELTGKRGALYYAFPRSRNDPKYMIMPSGPWSIPRHLATAVLDFDEATMTLTVDETRKLAASRW